MQVTAETYLAHGDFASDGTLVCEATMNGASQIWDLQGKTPRLLNGEQLPTGDFKYGGDTGPCSLPDGNIVSSWSLRDPAKGLHELEDHRSGGHQPAAPARRRRRRRQRDRVQQVMIFEHQGVRPTLADGVFIATHGGRDRRRAPRRPIERVVRHDDPRRCLPIRIGARTNVQDGSVVHVTGGKARTTVAMTSLSVTWFYSMGARSALVVSSAWGASSWTVRSSKTAA